MTVFGWFKDGFEGREKANKAFEKYAKVLEKNNCKLLFWAGSYGVPEPAMYTVQFNDIKDWEKAGMELFQANPLDRTRTVFGWDYKD